MASEKIYLKKESVLESKALAKYDKLLQKFQVEYQSKSISISFCTHSNYHSYLQQRYPSVSVPDILLIQLFISQGGTPQISCRMFMEQKGDLFKALMIFGDLQVLNYSNLKRIYLEQNTLSITLTNHVSLQLKIEGLRQRMNVAQQIFTSKNFNEFYQLIYEISALEQEQNDYEMSELQSFIFYLKQNDSDYTSSLSSWIGQDEEGQQNNYDNSSDSIQEPPEIEAVLNEGPPNFPHLIYLMKIQSPQFYRSNY